MKILYVVWKKFFSWLYLLGKNINSGFEKVPKFQKKDSKRNIYLGPFIQRTDKHYIILSGGSWFFWLSTCIDLTLQNVLTFQFLPSKYTKQRLFCCFITSKQHQPVIAVSEADAKGWLIHLKEPGLFDVRRGEWKRPIALTRTFQDGEWGVGGGGLERMKRDPFFKDTGTVCVLSLLSSTFLAENGVRLWPSSCVYAILQFSSHICSNVLSAKNCFKGADSVMF